MKFALLILSDPNQAGAMTALQFAKAALAAGHLIERIFFYGSGVYLANDLQQPPQGETGKHVQWQDLAQTHDIDLVVCIAAGLRRGVVDTREASRYQLAGHNLAEHFQLSGLGQLVAASVTCDRLVTFG